MPTTPNYYEILGVAKDASEDDIKKAYRKLARELHPDVNKAKDAPARFQQVQDAYEVLSDPAKRADYDRGGRRHHRTAGGRPTGTYTWSNIGGDAGAGADPGDLGDIFEELFGGGGGGGFGGGGRSPFDAARTRSKPVRGRDISRELEVAFLTAARGGTEPLRVMRGGRTQTIEVTIPKGTSDGAKLRMRGQGAPSPGGGPSGDLILTIKVGAHPLYRREGLDLVFDLPVTIAEAALGTKVDVPTLDGKRVELSVPAGSSSGRQLRLRGLGVSDEKGVKGDLRAVLKVIAPTALSESDRASLRELGERMPNPRQGSPWE